ncbi:MAG: YggS family pyridoxal phosphate-dependent enzyme [Gammaproteobacteria bacterium]|jgi:pyridoxal phosphate enzyme (YggS family)|nr:YggS family pyridoxal phosphate-dependent enzyme [Gammaproteobacteria bacterium]
MTLSIPENLEKVRQLISLYQEMYARNDTPVQLIAVSKTHDADAVKTAFQAGQMQFGENYLQEALEKIETLKALPLVWHFIGPIQSNKTRAIAESFHWVHSVDRLKIAQRLNDQRPESLPPLNILLQVNINEEDSKSGVTLDTLETLASEVNALPRLKLSGLMAIPTATNDSALQRQNFHSLRVARDKLVLAGFTSCTHLSMGMSNDFEAAIAEGATMIRIGTDIFGPRIPARDRL